MSSGDLQGGRPKRAKLSLDMVDNVNTQASSSGQRSLGTSIQPADQQTSTTTGLDRLLSAFEPSSSSMEENKLTDRGFEGIPSADEVSSHLNPKSSHSRLKPHGSNLSNPENKNEFLNLASETKEKGDEISTIAQQSPSKKFSLCISKLPFTKAQIAESLSLAEACGLLPSLMNTKREDLRGMENELDQVLVDLQLALLEARHLCILLENAPTDVPQDIRTARVQAERLRYLQTSSFRTFKNLYQWGVALKERIPVYCKESDDYHKSLDVLIEYIVEGVLHKCVKIEETSGVLV